MNILPEGSQEQINYRTGTEGRTSNWSTFGLFNQFMFDDRGAGMGLDAVVTQSN